MFKMLLTIQEQGINKQITGKMYYQSQVIRSDGYCLVISLVLDLDMRWMTIHPENHLDHKINQLKIYTQEMTKI